MATNSPFAVFSPAVERSSLVAFAIVAVEVDDRMSERGVALDQAASDFDGLVGRVVEQLDVELVFRIVEAADGVEQAVDHVLLVEDRQLHGDARQFVRNERAARSSCFSCACNKDRPASSGARHRPPG